MIASVLNQVSLFFIPGIITLVIFFGIYKRVPVYDLFIEGTKEGLKTAMEILPFIIAIFVGIEALTSSGAMKFLERRIGPGLSVFRHSEGADLSGSAEAGFGKRLSGSGAKDHRTVRTGQLCRTFRIGDGRQL